jgi:hypothetical protein
MGEEGGFDVWRRTDGPTTMATHVDGRNLGIGIHRFVRLAVLLLVLPYRWYNYQ